jgi:hypothetical protein
VVVVDQEMALKEQVLQVAQVAQAVVLMHHNQVVLEILHQQAHLKEITEDLTLEQV